MKPYVTLTSDWHLKDPYISIFKADLLKKVPEALIFDLSHNLKLGAMVQAAFLLKNCYKRFPEGSLHIFLVANSLNSQQTPILVKYDNHYFLGEDNGIFSLVAPKNECQAYEFKHLPQDGFLNNLILLASWVLTDNLANNVIPYHGLIEKLGDTWSYNKGENILEGQIVYIDANYNAVTNIPTEVFRKYIKQGTPFEGILKVDKRLKINKIYDYYNENELEVYFVENRLGFIEITMYNANIALLADIRVGETLTIKINR